ncbi:hypothetical protein [Undibacterium sp. Ji49W]|uniref:hypothetical protein n=1 Tax=Undibacterium sp. Ji49W TaxID=3413040 RepID=UPI003BF095D4
MSNLKDESRELMIDEQLVFVPSMDEWGDIIEKETYRGVAVFSPNTKNLILELVSFVSKYSNEFCLGLYRPKGLKAWLPVPLFNLKEEWQRVQIEQIDCVKCNWKGKIANPSEPTLYFGTSNELAATQRAAMLSRCNCPKCGAPLARHAVWTED